jgi:predicted glycogen debranching enzyme
MSEADESREWVLTNTLGGFAMGSASGSLDRRYHSLLTAAQHPPVLRMNLLSRVDERLILDPGADEIAIQLTPMRFVGGAPSETLCSAFEKTPSSVMWTFTIDTPKGVVVVRKELQLADGADASRLRYSVQCERPCRLEIRPLLAMRDFHALNAPGTISADDLTIQSNGAECEITRAELTLAIRSEDCEQLIEPCIWNNFDLASEQDRGLDHVEDLYCPCVYTSHGNCALEFAADGSMTLDWDANRAHKQERIDAMIQSASGGINCDERALNAIERLCAAADDFIVRREHEGERSTSVLAGYPWFSDWGRDTMIALPGLLLTTGRHAEAFQTLKTFANAQRRGLIPNRFDDWMGAAHYNTVDASLWFVHACAEYVRSSDDQSGFDEHLADPCKRVIDAYIRGTDFGISVDPLDGLVSAGNAHTQLTWMDAQRDGITFTPRHGKAIEINALWINALRSLAELISSSDISFSKRCTQAADLAHGSLTSSMTSGHDGLVDCLSPASRTRGVVWERSSEIRPNQLFAVSLPRVGIDERTQRIVVDVCTEHLLTPMGMRTLAPSDPAYCPVYQGPLIERDRAYHNGTVWPWLLGAMCEADMRVNGFDSESRSRTIRRVCELVDEMDRAAIGSIAEIYDADRDEHGVQHARGCPAQAWSIAEPLRVLLLACRGS